MRLGGVTALLLLLCIAAPVRAQTASAAAAGTAISVPDGYVLQRLDVTDGAIARPRDWYYANEGTPSGWLWTLSKEKPGERLKTDMRIQMFVKIAEGSKYTAETFAQHILAEQKQGADSVVSECMPSAMGNGFTRQCLEVVRTFQDPDGARKYHVQYSVFWAGDVAFLVTFETPLDNWNDETKAIAANMAAFRIYGPNLSK